MADLDAVEDRIWGTLNRYRDELEEATIYGMPSLRWPGSGGHDYFAAVKRSAPKVSLYAIAVDTWPEALEGSSEEFRKRRTGKATFSFPSLDDELAAELEAFLARLYQPYREHHADPRRPRAAHPPPGHAAGRAIVPMAECPTHYCSPADEDGASHRLPTVVNWLV